MRNVLVAVVVALATATHALVWLVLHEQVSPPNASGVLDSVSFSPINPNRDAEHDSTDEAQITSDLAAIAPYTRTIRTYSATKGLELVPALASQYGLHVTLGVWLSDREDQNEKEIESAIDLAKRYRNVEGIIVGNETIYRNRTLYQRENVQDLIAKIQRVKREVSVPVTTAEVWDVWLDHPELVSAVDYLAVHILPYWEGIPGSSAVDHAMKVYERLRQAYPGKRIVIAEFGWPSAGLNRKDAEPSPITQAQIVRDFVARSDAMGIDYSIVEAFDQPWKTNEGSVGPYWGIFDADRNPKFAFAGTVETPNFLLKMMAALAIGLLLSIPIFGIPRATAAQAGVLALTASAIGAWSANVIDYWVTHYFVLGSQIALFVGAGLLVPLIVIMKRRIEELAAILFGAKGRRLLTQGGGMPEQRAAGVDPYPRLPRAARDAAADARCRGRAQLAQFRMRGGHQQHARSRHVGPDRGPLPAARPTLQIPARRPASGLQGRRAQAGARAHRARGRDHRRARRGLCGASRLAEGFGAGLCRSGRGPGAGAAGSPRRVTDRHASGDEPRICGLLRHRHGGAERGQRHRGARHDVPDPARGA